MYTKRWIFLVSLVAALLALAACVAPTAPDATAPESEGDGGYPPGTLTTYGYGQPQYREMFYNQALEDNPDLAPGVTVEIIQTEGEADARQKVQLSYTAGAWDELPDAVSSAPVSMQAMADG